MIEFDNWGFHGAPGVGVPWFMGVLESVGIYGLGDPYIPSTSDYSGLSVTIVRHPYDWLSWLFHNKFRVRRNPFDGLGAFGHHLQRTSKVEDFIRRVLYALPAGSIGEFFDRRRADTVMRYEDMPYACIEFLESLGVTECPQRVYQIPFIRSSRELGKADPLRKSLIQSEAHFCSRYEYV